jgi:hypothetical protein
MSRQRSYAGNEWPFAIFFVFPVSYLPNPGEKCELDVAVLAILSWRASSG